MAGPAGSCRPVTQSGGTVSLLLAGVLYVAIGLKGIVAIDFLTYFFAIGALLAVRIPQPEPAGDGSDVTGSLLKDAAFGWHYLVNRIPLLAMLLYYALVNYLLGITIVLVTPLVLTFGTARILGAVSAAGSVGMLAGSLVMSAWGGPK